MPKNTDTDLHEKYRLLERVCASAENHGVESDERDQEVGDLQDALKVAFERLTLEQARAVVSAHFEDHGEWTDDPDDYVGPDEEE